MKLPNYERAMVDIEKLQDYCLSGDHPRGRHKARVFASALGIRQEDAEVLRRALLEGAVDGEAKVGERDDYGQRYVLDFEMAGPGGRAFIRSSWIVRRGEDFPRFVTCYVV